MTSLVSSPPPEGLASRSATAFGWGVSASIGKVVLTIAVQATLARLLGPAEFGIFALGMLIMGLAGYFADIGLATGLVARQTLRDSDVRFVLTANLAISLLVAVLVMLVAAPLAGLFNKPEAEGIFRGLAPVFVLNAMASVSVSLLRREMDYRTIQLSGLIGYFFGFGLVGVGAAYLFGSVYALVAAYLAQSVITLVLLYRKTRHPIGLTMATPERADFVGFGFNVLVTNVVNWLVQSIDRLLVGRLFAAASLGQYTAAYNLVYAPVGTLYPNVQSTVFSAMARMEQDHRRIARAYLELLQAVATLLIPPFVGVYFLAPALVATVYGGDQWQDAMRIAGPFCLMAPFIVVWACSTPVLWNAGRRSLEWKVQLPFIAVALLVVSLAARESIVAVAWGTAALYISRTLVIMWMACRTVSVSAAQLAVALLPAVCLSVLVAGPVWSTATLLGPGRHPAFVVLAVGLIVIGICMLICLLSVPGCLPATLRKMVARRHDASPRWLQPLFHRLGNDR